MVKVPIYALLLSIALAGVISTGAEAQDYVVHTFRCPDTVRVPVNYARKIGSDPSFSLEGNPALNPSFRVSSWDQHQRVSCWYFIGAVQKDVKYAYTVKRTVLSCENVGKAVFTCNLKR